MVEREKRSKITTLFAVIAILAMIDRGSLCCDGRNEPQAVRGTSEGRSGKYTGDREAVGGEAYIEWKPGMIKL